LTAVIIVSKRKYLLIFVYLRFGKTFRLEIPVQPTQERKMNINKFFKHVVVAAAMTPLCLVLTANAEPNSAAMKEKKVVAEATAAAAVNVIAMNSDKADARPAGALLDAKALPPADDERYQKAIQIVANPACTVRSPCMLA
jgi:hypothetical protein